jgi:hypothetical protein
VISRPAPAVPLRLPLLLLATAAAGLAVPWFLLRVVGWGRYIPQADLAADYSSAVVWAVALGVFILLWPIGWRERLAFLGLWTARSVVALGAMLPIEHFYPHLDGYSYFLLSTRSAVDPASLSLGNGTGNLIQFVALHNVFLPDSYHAQKVTFAFAGLLSVFCLYRSFVLLAGRHDFRILAGIGLFPSLLYWSSVLNKDPLVLLGTSMFVLGTVGWYRGAGNRYVLLMAAGIALASAIRIWSAVILLAPTFVLILFRMRTAWQRALALAAAGLVAAVTLSRMAQIFAITSLDDLVAAADLWSRAWAIGGSGRAMSGFDSLGDVLLFMPIGAFTALFRPLPGEIMNPFGLMAGFENLLLLWLAAAAIFRFKRSDFRQPLLLWALVLIVVWSAAYGVVAYQNLGTASRFKLQVLPILLATLVWLGRREWVVRTAGAVPESAASTGVAAPATLPPANSATDTE